MFWSVTLSLLQGFGKSFQLFALTLLFALPLGLIISFGSMSRFPPAPACSGAAPCCPASPRR